MKHSSSELGDLGNQLIVRLKWARKQPVSFIVMFGHFLVLTVSHDAREGTLSLWTPSNIMI